MNGSSLVADVYLRMVGRWARILAGGSYYHVSQGPGPHFEPDRLSGYFIDLRAKTRWPGPTDAAGIPLNRGRGDALVHFPTTIFHKALGHWDAWLASGRSDRESLDRMNALVQWARDHQDERGGWPWPAELRWPGALSPYSAMSQGEGASLLCRAHQVTGGDELLDAAERALELALTPVEQGGASRWTDGGLFLEEYPQSPPRTVLNGWIYALYGLHDSLLVRANPRFRESLALTVRTLVRVLPRFDCGGWSLYDSAGTIASPSYQRRHVAQLGALERTFPEHAGAIAPVRRTFERQLKSRIAVVRAVAAKALQKLRQPPDFVLR